MHAAVDWHRRHIDVGRARAHPVAWVTEQVRDGIWCWHASKHIDDTQVRHTFSHIDVLMTALIGILRDDVIWKGFDSINHLDLREWLAKHGLQQTSLSSPDVRVVYDESFAGAGGPNALDTGAPSGGYRPQPSFAAGAALYGLLRTQLPYRGSVMWQPVAGMGDTVIAPMYETLVQRGVKVEFFQKVTNLGVDAARGAVHTIEIVEQATPLDEYEPLIDVDGLRCWPAAPRWEALRDGQQLKSAGLDFEGGDEQHRSATRQLIEGEHFDHVVLAISAAALAPICGEVIAYDAAFTNMLRHTNTVMTQAFQIWLTRPTDALGFHHGHSATSTFIEPLDTGCDNSQVLPFEPWPSRERPASVWYFCGILPDLPGDDPTITKAHARDGALDYLKEIGMQWPDAVDGKGFRWELLVAPAGTTGVDRFDAQYWRANAAPSERYVQTLPGSVAHRLSAGKASLSNLYLAGDWTRNGFNIGAVEAAVMSGMQASRAISGSPKKVAWEAGMWMAH